MLVDIWPKTRLMSKITHLTSTRHERRGETVLSPLHLPGGRGTVRGTQNSTTATKILEQEALR